MGCNFLAKKIMIWFNENNGKVEKDFTFRFRGKESFLYMQKFPELINMIIEHVDNNQVIYRLHQIYYQSICMRKVLSYSVRIDSFTLDDLGDMKKQSNSLFKSCCIYDQKISPSLWTLCNAAHFHAEQTLRDYGMGFGCNTMEGREQKHQQLKKYAENTTFQCRWPLIFRHEFIQLIHLRENGFDNIRYRKRGVNYVPKLKENHCPKCSCAKLLDENNKCKICDSVHMQKVEQFLASH